METKYYSMNDIAKMLSVNRYTIHRLIQNWISPFWVAIERHSTTVGV